MVFFPITCIRFSLLFLEVFRMHITSSAIGSRSRTAWIYCLDIDPYRRDFLFFENFPDR